VRTPEDEAGAAMRPKDDSLDVIVREVIACRRCPRLVRWRERVARERKRAFSDQEYWGRPVPAFGDPTARLLVIGLAPAAHGGNRTGRIFTGDRSGEWLFRALHRAGFANQPVAIARDDGLVLRDCFITAAVRCAPPDNRPSRAEFARCQPFLERELLLLTDLKVVLALGESAMAAFLRVWREIGREVPRPRPKFRHGGSWELPPVTLLTSYHPSQRNTSTGLLRERMFDAVFRRAREILRRERPIRTR